MTASGTPSGDGRACPVLEPTTTRSRHMTLRRTDRSMPLVLATLVAGAIVALAFAGVRQSAARAATVHSHAQPTTTHAVALRVAMRHPWEDHVSWTRMAMIGLTENLPDTKVTVARLLRNQADIGNAIKPYYGK